jgi:glycosyltransferase involved in cell wall biosynthesis
MKFDPVTKLEGGIRTLGVKKQSQPGKPLITIVTVVFNGEEFLEQTINSIISQSYNNIEFIVIDGGSTDGTLDIIKKYENSIDYWLSEKDCGIYDAMNKGIDLARGDWINFLNAADEFYDDEVLNKVVLKANSGSYGLVYGDMYVINENLTPHGIVKALKFNWFNLMIFNTRVICHQAMIVHRSYIVKYSDKYKFKGELNWYFDLLEKNIQSISINQPMVKYLLGGVGEKNIKLNRAEARLLLKTRYGFMWLLSLPFITYAKLRLWLRK